MRRAERAGVWPGGSPTLGAAGGDPPPRDPELRRPTHASPPGAGGRRADFFQCGQGPASGARDGRRRSRNGNRIGNCAGARRAHGTAQRPGRAVCAAGVRRFFKFNSLYS